MMVRKRWLAVAVFWIAVISMIGCSSDKKIQGKPKKPPRVEAVPAEKIRLVELLETTGNVVAVNTVTLGATVEGPISFCPWREGDRVERVGQKLIEVDRPLYRQEVAVATSLLAVAQAKLADLKAGARPEEIAQAKESVRHFEDCTSFAKADLDRFRSLVESGSLPAESAEKARVDYVKCHSQLEAAKEQLAMLEAGPTITEIAVAQAAVDEAAAKQALAQAKLDECALTAPFAGVITEVYVRPGDLATPRAPLLKMMDPSSLVVRAGLPESCAASIRKGTEATVRLDAYPGKTFHAKIERVYPRLEQESRTRIIEARILDRVELIPRLFARLSVQGRVVDDAVVVPDAAIVTTPRGYKVVFVVNGRKVSMRRVEIGLEQMQRVQVTAGVQPGELVVTDGNLNLKDGTQVNLGEQASNLENRNVGEGKECEKAELYRIAFQDKFPIRLGKYNKTILRYGTLDEICQYIRDKIEEHPFAFYIDTFDHYQHSTGLCGGIVHSDIVNAKNIIFCFGKKLDSPEVLSVRPRSIGICETKSQFVISFLEAPSSAATETMEKWICEIPQKSPGVESRPLPGVQEQ